MDLPHRQENNAIRDLGEGLVLRRAVPADSEQLAAFNALVHTENESKQPDERIGEWTRDLMTRPHPTTTPSDFTVVENLHARKIVSTLVLISQTWSYAGIEFKVGRPELVGTDPDYRNRGLVRAQLEVIHAWSTERGELVQGITGIPHYYRQFSYEMGLELGGGKTGFVQQVPKLAGEEPFKLRPATAAHIPFLVDQYRLGNQRYLVCCSRDEEIWGYELNGRTPKNVTHSVIKIIESRDGEVLGYITHPPNRWGTLMAATGFEIKAGISWAAITPSVMRYLKAVGKEYPVESGEEQTLERVGFWLGNQHPVYEAVPEKLSQTRDPYAWYLRVPDLPKFLQRISTELERRLAGSTMAGHSGEIKITFYRRGLRMVLEEGRVVVIEDWTPEPDRNSGQAGFPGLTFLQLVFGYRSLQELKYAFADCWTKGEEVPVLLEILFPKQASSVWPLS